MSFLRALRAYVGLGPDEDIEDRYLYELNSRRRVLDLDELEEDEADFERALGEADIDDLDLHRLNAGARNRAEIDLRDLEADETVEVRPSGSRGRGRSGTPKGPAGSRRAGGVGRGAGGQRHHGDDQEPDPVVERVTAEFLSNRSPFEVDDEIDDEADGRAEPRRGPTDPAVGESADGVAEHTGRDTGASGRGAADDSTSRKAGRRRNRQADRAMDQEGYRVKQGGGTMAKETSSAGEDDGVVRSLDSMRAKPRTLIPESFADAKLVADEFKRDVPVLLNLQGLDRDLARRLIDFASGICYALDGSMEKVASQVFLLIPDGGEVSDEDRRRIEERGYAR